MNNQKFIGIFLLFILFAYCVRKVEGGSDDETEVNEATNKCGEGSGTQENAEDKKVGRGRTIRNNRHKKKKRIMERLERGI
ncbi:unnamed protein product [Meloidogyne enterolobii]|uniref:Uncharacterized protein n=1 Tax=Meloidogyne enterolobii TaxID=390850 RepID=A0ACB0XUY1_MELEN